MNDVPVRLPIAIVIATYNRREDLRVTLGHLREREPVGQIIVVDNASTDGTAEMVRVQYPEAALIALPENEGVPAFGIGVKAAVEPFVFLLDDDAVPARGTLVRSMSILEQDRRVAVVACHIVDASRKAVTQNWPSYPLLFWGCGACVRREAIEQEPYFFDPRLFLHGTEMDLAIRLYARGRLVRYANEAVVHHRFSATGRSEPRRIYFLVQNAIWFGLKHFPVRYAVPAICRHLAVLLGRATRAHCIGAFLSGLLKALGEAPRVFSRRNPVPPSIARVYYEQVFEFEPITNRLLRAWRGLPGERQANMKGMPLTVFDDVTP